MNKLTGKIMLKKSAYVAVVFAILILLVNFIFIMSQINSFFTEKIEDTARQTITIDAKKVNDYLNEKLNVLQEISLKAVKLSSPAEIKDLLSPYYEEEQFDDFAFFDGENYYEGLSGFVISNGVKDEVKALVEGNKPAVSQSFTNTDKNVLQIAFFVPVHNGEFIKGLIGYINTIELVSIEDIYSYDFTDEKSISFAAVASKDGVIIDFKKAPTFHNSKNRIIYDYLYEITKDRSVVDQIKADLLVNGVGSTKLNIFGEKYIVTYKNIDVSGDNIFALNIHNVNEVLKTDYLNIVLSIVTVTLIILILLIIILYYYLVIRKFKKEREMYDDIDPLLGCNSFNKFKREATEILNANKFSQYALVYLGINKFSFIQDQFGQEITNETLRYIGKVISKCITPNETYGHISDDKFIFLIRYSRVQELNDRIMILRAVINNFETLKNRDYTLILNIGVFCIDHERSYTIQEMIDRAIIAQGASSRNLNEPYVIYDSSVRATYIREAEIEAKMEQSLKKDEFKIFFQPKYSFDKDRVEGAEVLVRWFDPEKNDYISPSEFVPLFEANGFITKLDKYVFTEACKFLENATAKGERAVPLSINVSRVTAVQTDFLNYYINTKKRFGIADNFLTIEFTESFALEKYDTMRNIVTTLKNNGINASIDDFGSGYSSFNILKELSMSELKLDKFFLESGFSKERDDILLSMVINLAKAFGMKVTQEGVETKEQVERLRGFGCDVIQGYYYSKPLSADDFRRFLASNTSLASVVESRRPKKTS